MPKVSQEHLDARRAQILEGARNAFSRFGYDGATVARLEEEIGLSRGAIFNYFHGKKALFAALAQDVSRRYGSLIMEDGLDAAIRAMAEESPEWLGVILETHARLRHDPEFEQLMAPPEDGHGALPAWFEEQQRAGAFRQDISPLDLGRFATMVLNGLALRVVAGDDTDVEATTRLLHDALGPRQ